MNLFKGQIIEFEPSPFDHGIKSDYAITLAIPSFKKVNHAGIYKAYNLFTEDIQKKILTDYFITSLTFCKNEQTPEIYFEFHKDGRVHAHTYLKNLTYDQIYEIQQYFCKDIIKIRPKQFQQVFNFFKPDNFHYWLVYCQKSQNSLDEDLAELNKSID